MIESSRHELELLEMRKKQQHTQQNPTGQSRDENDIEYDYRDKEPREREHRNPREGGYNNKYYRQNYSEDPQRRMPNQQPYNRNNDRNNNNNNNDRRPNNVPPEQRTNVVANQQPNKIAGKADEHVWERVKLSSNQTIVTK